MKETRAPTDGTPSGPATGSFGTGRDDGNNPPRDAARTLPIIADRTQLEERIGELK